MSPRLAQTFLNEPKCEVILNFKIRNLARCMQKTNKQKSKVYAKMEFMVSRYYFTTCMSQGGLIDG